MYWFQKRNQIELVAVRKGNWLAWAGLGLMSVQFGILARLTWWEYSWDIMEPVTYFVTYGTAMAAYAYFVLTKEVRILKLQSEYFYPRVFVKVPNVLVYFIQYTVTTSIMGTV